MKDSYVWFWGGRTALFLVVVCLVTGFAGAQEGEGEGEGETPGLDPCTEMDLTTQQAYTLPVLPPILTETLTYTYPGNGALKARVWVKVVQYSGHPADSFTITAGGVTVPLTNWGLLDTWQFLDLDVPAPGAGSHTITIQSVTRTDMPNYKPTLVLVGTVLAGPSGNFDGFSDTLASFAYTSTFSSPDFTLRSIQTVGDTDVLDDKPWPNDAAYFARLGGLTRPRIAASIRHDIVTEEEDEGETEGEGEPAPEGEGEVELQGWVQFRYGDEDLCAQISFQNLENGNIPDCCYLNTGDPPNPCPGGCEWCTYWLNGDCRRVSMFIPPYLLGSAQRPALRVKVDSSETGSRLIVDDFVLTYVSQALENAIPSLLHTGNLIENGNFENGEYPFVIQSPTGQTNCARITDVIRDIDDACRGDAAAVFDGQVSTTPMVAYCEADALIGRGQTGTLALYGLNLESITNVVLIPEAHAGDPFDAGNYIFLSGPSEIEYEGDLEKVVYTFRFDSPFNVGVGGEVICTDGRATFEYTAPGLDQASQDTGVCATVIDTLPPVLVVNSPEGINAAEGWPAVYGTNRVQAPNLEFPPSWILTSGSALTPKNAASFSRQDMHVYLNAGSRVGKPYAESSDALEPLYFSVWAYFVDPAPVDGAGTVYEVQRAGFQAAFYPEPATEGEPPAAISPFARYRGVRWNGSTTDPTSINLLALAAVPSLDRPNEMNVTWNVEVPTIPPPGDKYWWARFKFEVSDRANNLLDISKDNAVNIHWLWVTQAEVTSGLNMAEHAPQLTWRLRTPELPGAPPACAPLARFRLYVEEPGGGLTLLGASEWLQGPLRDTTIFSGPEGSTSLRNWVNANKGRRIHLDIIGADETGNVQYDPGPAGTIGELEDNSEGEVGVDRVYWDEEVRDYQNTALDTAVGVRLYHERSDLTPVNDFGGATRVPLPPLCDACYTRVNGNVWFRAMVPAQSGGPVVILWKFYKDGMLSARGVIPVLVEDNLSATALLMDLLPLTGTATNLDGVQDFDASTGALNTGTAAIRPEAFLNRLPYEDPCSEGTLCPELGEFDFRLGDEGDPPKFDENPNAALARRREVHYLITAQTVINGSLIDTTPATARFSVYPLETEETVRDEMPVREYSR